MKIVNRSIKGLSTYPWEYCISMWKHGKWWLSLFFAGVAVFFLEKGLMHPLQKWSLTFLSIVGYTVASFRAWLDKQKKTEKPTEQEKEVLPIVQSLDDAQPLRATEKLEIIDGLIATGRILYNQMLSSNGANGVSEAKEWINEVCEFGRKHLGPKENDELNQFQLRPTQALSIIDVGKPLTADSQTGYQETASETGYKLTVLKTLRYLFVAKASTREKSIPIS